jgi:choline dehydrogenase-like flavoprotein
VESYPYLIIGSGAGGATLACELARHGKKALVLEKGRADTEVGTFWAAGRFYDLERWRLRPKKTVEGVTVWRCFAAGGTTLAALANGARSLQSELSALGVELEQEFVEGEREMRIAPLPEDLMSDGAKTLMRVSHELDLKMQPMPKYINPIKCTRCGKCVFGCADDAKWTALEYLHEAEQKGVELRCSTTVDRVIIENGRATKVVARGPAGTYQVGAEVIIVAAGALESPAILLRSGLEGAGESLFIDPMVHVYGVTEQLSLKHEPGMAIVDLEFEAEKGFLLSSYVGPTWGVRYMEAGLGGALMPGERTIGIMTKISDQMVGHVRADGTVSKTLTERDWERLNAGAELSEKILTRAGADPRSFRRTKIGGAHPGGTAPIGKVVDRDLRTCVDNLFVCDASVLPAAPGLPPILTIVALAKRLGRALAA